MKENGVSGLPSFVLSWSMKLWPPCRFRLCCPSCIVRWRTDSEILPGSFPRNLVVNWGFFDTFWKWSWGWGMANDPTLPVVFLSSLMSFWQNHISTNWITIKFSLVIMLFSLMTNSLGITPLPCESPANLPAWLKNPLWSQRSSGYCVYHLGVQGTVKNSTQACTLSNHITLPILLWWFCSVLGLQWKI